ncbi:methyl-accepting chemotaxis protein [Paenibacillus cremeus]|uniref:Methyl-accepting chemotaxis protein n=1 Tax=Paenibacillus cremeus TaxID=2163881 RepID=A0A559K0M1_9BACL|nr:methyl-accepting chemotaxis protein [Paenibacillus cremeus]TVY05694.1 methyl-accepting chemotaxis protein [Paenibacillus cremeus]
MRVAALLKTVGAVCLTLLVVSMVCVVNLNNSFKAERSAVSRQVEYKQLGTTLANASDYLTNEARRYTIFGDQAHYNNYMKEVNETKTRDMVVSRLKELRAPQEELDLIEQAKKNSDNLIQTETNAFKAVASGDLDRARKLMFDAEYDKSKKLIMTPIEAFQEKMNRRATNETEQARSTATFWLSMTTTSLIVLGVILTASLVALFIRIVGPLRQLNHSIENLASSDGDLTVRLPVKGRDEFSSISEAFNRMVANLHGLIGQIAQISRSLTQSCEEVSLSTNEIALGNQQQASSMDSINHSLKEMVSSIEEVAQNADKMSTASTDAVQAANSGSLVLTTTLSQLSEVAVHINELSSKSQQINDIVVLIDDIAAQTKLLALNAAIEAARAGEAGRGFAVVADEVGKLAQRSGEATQNISSIINIIQSDTEQSVSAMRRSSEMTFKVEAALQNIVSVVSDSSSRIDEIAGACNAQSRQTQTLLLNVQSMSAVTEQTSAGAQENAAAANELNEMASTLNRLICRFII